MTRLLQTITSAMFADVENIGNFTVEDVEVNFEMFDAVENPNTLILVQSTNSIHRKFPHACSINKGRC